MKCSIFYNKFCLLFLFVSNMCCLIIRYALFNNFDRLAANPFLDLSVSLSLFLRIVLTGFIDGISVITFVIPTINATRYVIIYDMSDYVFYIQPQWPICICIYVYVSIRLYCLRLVVVNLFLILRFSCTIELILLTKIYKL